MQARCPDGSTLVWGAWGLRCELLLPDGFSSRMASPSPPLKVPVTWQELVDDSDRVDYSLEETKKEFSETTRKQVNRRGGYTRDRCGCGWKKH